MGTKASLEKLARALKLYAQAACLSAEAASLFQQATAELQSSESGAPACDELLLNTLTGARPKRLRMPPVSELERQRAKNALRKAGFRP